LARTLHIMTDVDGERRRDGKSFRIGAGGIVTPLRERRMGYLLNFGSGDRPEAAVGARVGTGVGDPAPEARRGGAPIAGRPIPFFRDGDEGRVSGSVFEVAR
jgi:hypothetical protein